MPITGESIDRLTYGAVSRPHFTQAGKTATGSECIYSGKSENYT